MVTSSLYLIEFYVPDFHVLLIILIVFPLFSAGHLFYLLYKAAALLKLNRTEIQ